MPPNGGYDFAADPALGWREATLFWLPDIAADVISLIARPAGRTDLFRVSELLDRSRLRRSAADGEHLIMPSGTQVWLSRPFTPTDAVLATVPVGPTSRRWARTPAALQRALIDDRPAPRAKPSAQAAVRHRHRLQAYDGHSTGASVRAIAQVLFGANRVPRGIDWKTHDLRFRTLRLVRDAKAFVGGSYRALLA